MTVVGGTQNNHASSMAARVEHMQTQWLFTSAELLKSPSILEGMPVSQELANRQKGVNFITQVGIALRLPQLTLATASIFLHRFYMRYPMQVSKDKGIHHYQVAATALFLATKVEENCRKMRELIVACCRVAQKQPNLVVDDQSKEYWKWRDTILHNEDVLLEALCFDLQLKHPYHILFDFLCYYSVQDQKALRNTSWAFMNDSHVTTMCLLFPARTIAGAALYAGIRLAGTTLPDDSEQRPWWEHLELDILDIKKACNQMADVYENPNLPRQGSKDAYLKEEDAMSFERTRRTQSPVFEPSPAHSMRSASQGVKRDREEESWGQEQKNGHHNDSISSRYLEAEHSIPSPKKQRTDSLKQESETESIRPPRIPISTEGRIPVQARNLNDGVQARIDNIVKASGQSHATDAQRRPSNSGRASNDDSKPITGNDITTGEAAEQNGSHLPAENTNKTMPDHAESIDYGSEEGEV